MLDVHNLKIGRTQAPPDIAADTGQGPAQPQMAKPDPITEVVSLPARLYDLCCQFERLAGILEKQYSGIFQNTAVTGAVTQIGSGSTGYLQVWQAELGVLIRLRHISLSTSAAALTAHFYAVRGNNNFSTTVGARYLGTVRIGASGTTVAFHPSLLLMPGEGLYVYDATANSDTIDFSAEFARAEYQ